MSWILVLENNTFEYPFTLTSLHRLYPNVSFPDDWDIDLSDFGVFPVKQIESPKYDPFYDVKRSVQCIDGEWTEIWTRTPASPEQIEERALDAGEAIRTQRNELLARTDWTQLPDVFVDKSKWALYRQQLRDITSQPGFPWNVTWPVWPSI